MSIKWQSVGEEQFHFEKAGDTLEGKLLSKEESQLGVGFYHIIPEGESKSVGFLGSKGLDRLMAEVEEGDMVRIILRDVVPTRSGNRFKDYSVFVGSEG